MAGFKKNPHKPYEVKVPNKIRKKIKLHERDSIELGPTRFLMPSLIATQLKKRGSLWSRFISWVRNIFVGYRGRNKE